MLTRDGGGGDDEREAEVAGDPLRVLLVARQLREFDCIQRSWLACRKIGGGPDQAGKQCGTGERRHL
jgi:hypothetical protein